MNVFDKNILSIDCELYKKIKLCKKRSKYIYYIYFKKIKNKYSYIVQYIGKKKKDLKYPYRI